MAAIVEISRGYLMLQRGGPELGVLSEGRGDWCFPGGWLEPGETAPQAAVRECEEETDVLVRPLFEDGYDVRQSASGLTLVTLFVRCQYLGREPRNREPRKALAVEWIHPQLLTELDLFAPTEAWWRRPKV